MADLGITLQGSEELKAKLKAVEEKLKSSDADSLIKRGAMLVVRQAMENATGRPGPMVRTNRLRSSITPDVISYDSARVGTNVEYAPFVEFGHRQKAGRFVPAIGKRLVADFAPAYPFLYPAAEQVVSELKGLTVTYGNEIKEDWEA